MYECVLMYACIRAYFTEFFIPQNQTAPTTFSHLWSIYTDSTFQVKTASGLTRPMTRGKGIIQGCPWLVIISEQGVDKWLRWIEQGHTTPFTPDSVQGYVDDMDMTATNEDDVKEAIQRKLISSCPTPPCRSSTENVPCCTGNDPATSGARKTVQRP